MKKLLLILPILFTSACSSSNYIYECNNINSNFIKKDLIEKYNKEKTVFVDEKDNDFCVNSRRCHLIVESDRWNNIEIYLNSGSLKKFPISPGLYSISRDYSLKNCIPVYSSYRENIYTDKYNNKFCVSAKIIENPTAKIKFKSEQYTKNETKTMITFININVYYNEEKMIETNSIVSDSRYNQSVCKKQDDAQSIVNKDF